MPCMKTADLIVGVDNIAWSVVIVRLPVSPDPVSRIFPYQRISIPDTSAGEIKKFLLQLLHLSIGMSLCVLSL